MTEYLPPSNQTRATFSLSGSDNQIHVNAPGIHRNFTGTRSTGKYSFLRYPPRLSRLASVWMVSDSKTIPGELSYNDVRLLDSPETATAEVVVRKLVVEFKAFKPDEDREVVVAVFKSDHDVEAMVTTTSDGSWEAL